jgi:hypothetical protein
MPKPKKWRYDSDEKLMAAGFRRCAFTTCPICGRNLLVYMRGEDFPVFLNSTTFYPHLEPYHVSSDALPLDNKSRAAGEESER